MTVSRETRAAFERYVELLLKWNGAINLIGDEKDVWERHILDCYQLVPLIPSEAKALVDLGSGAGLPGIILAIATPLEITLVERDQRKASFLREAVRILALTNVTVLAEEAKKLNQTYDVITARAMASLDELCGLAKPLMGTKSICLFPKGENFVREIDEASAHWQFDCVPIPSKTNKNSAIVSMTKLSERLG